LHDMTYMSNVIASPRVHKRTPNLFFFCKIKKTALQKLPTLNLSALRKMDPIKKKYMCTYRNQYEGESMHETIMSRVRVGFQCKCI